MAHHVFSGQDRVDQHETLENFSDGQCARFVVDETAVWQSLAVQPHEIGILGYQDTPLARREPELSVIIGSEKSNVAGRRSPSATGAGTHSSR